MYQPCWRLRAVQGVSAARTADQRGGGLAIGVGVLVGLVFVLEFGDRGGGDVDDRQRGPPADTLEEMLSDQVPGRQRDRVVPIGAGHAQACPRLLGRLYQTVQRDVTQRVGPDRAADAVDLQPVRDQLRAGREVDAVEARPLDRRGRDAYVHL